MSDTPRNDRAAPAQPIEAPRFLPPDGLIGLIGDGDVTITFGRNCTVGTIHDLLELLVTGQLYVTGTLRGHVSQLAAVEIAD